MIDQLTAATASAGEANHELQRSQQRVRSIALACAAAMPSKDGAWTVLCISHVCMLLISLHCLHIVDTALLVMLVA